MAAWQISTGIIGVYLLITIAIGVVASRRLSVDVEDFFLYGRRAGFVVLYLTVVASYHSAFAFLGSGGFFYTHGIGFWEAGTWTVMVGAITYVLGTRIWAFGKAFGYMTPADLLADYYQSEVVRVVVAAVSVVFTILYIQVQALGLGYVISVASGGRISFEVGMLVMLVVAVGYLIAGGLRSVYWTDAVQGIWMYLAVWVGALVIAYQAFGGPIQLWQAVSRERPDLLTLPGPNGFFRPGMWFGLTIVLSFGIVFQPHMMLRYYSAASARTVKWLGATTPLYLMTLYIPAALVGLGGAVVMPGLEVPDRIFPELLMVYAPAWLTGLILAGAAAAAMSTVDSILHANMTVLTRDIYQRYLAPDREPAHYINVGRLAAILIMIIASWLALSGTDSLVVIVSMSGAGALQLMPGILNVCFPTRRTLTSSGMVAGVIAGLITLYLTSVVIPHPLGLHGGIWSLLVNFAVAVAVSTVTKSPDAQTRQRMRSVMEELVYGSGSATGEKA